MSAWYKVSLKALPYIDIPSMMQSAINLLKEAGCPKDAEIFSNKAPGHDDRVYFFSPLAAEILKEKWPDWVSIYPEEVTASSLPVRATLKPVKCE